MTLRKKAILIVVVAALSGLGALRLVTFRVIERGYADLQSKEALTDLQRAIQALINEQDTLLSKAADWAERDDTARFVQNGDEEFIKSHLGSTPFEGMRINAILLFNDRDELVWGSGYDLNAHIAREPSSGLLKRFSPGSRLLRHESTDGHYAGLMQVPDGPLLVAVRPVVASNGQGPIRGSLVFARIIDDTELQLLERITQLGINIWPLDSGEVPAEVRQALRGHHPSDDGLVHPLDDSLVSGYAVLDDIDHNPSLLLRVAAPRSIEQHGRSSARLVMLTMLLIAVLTGGVSLLLIEHLINARLARLNADVKRVTACGRLTERVGISGTDEVASLAYAINGMLGGLEETDRERSTAEDARRRSDQRFKQFYERSPDAILLLDESGFIDCNQAAVDLMRCRSRVELLKRPELLSPERQPDETSSEEKSSRMIREAVARGSHRFEWVYLRADGSELPVEVLLTDISTDGNVLIHVVWRDLSEKKVVDRELNAYREHLETLVDDRSRDLLQAHSQIMQNEKLASVGRLAAGVAHEINTPIQYIGDNLRALSDAFGDLLALVSTYRQAVEQAGERPLSGEEREQISAAEQERDLEYILEDSPQAIAQGLEGVQRVATIVKAMKDFSHVDRGQLSTVDLNHALQSTLTVARNEYKYVADVVTELGELPAVECYASELNQVFLNLIVNAAHAIADTGNRGTITIRTASEGDNVRIDIADSGTGIPEEIRKRIFEPFFTTKEVGKGTGQGLSIAYQIVVQKHGGSIDLESTIGTGTTFILRIPLRSAAPAAPAEQPAEAAAV